MTTPTSVGTPADAPVTPGVLPDGPVYPATSDGVLAALTALGDTADAVATALLALGYTGRPASPAYCPIAWYLIDAVPELDTEHVEVGCDDAGLWNAPRGHAIDVDLPDQVVAFITAFDGGAYPELAW
ncbi:hypothetical protein ACFPIJ_55205 [Dactylosporangium cerinum]|uniref:Uncharacterized protein n=1 Tax=Dactylosporangium cerinum TaxID=1434730 RepID=A0ABV9WIT1_9ACTN